MLMQIPGISNISAQCIIKEYSTIYNLINCINKDKDCLNSIQYKTEKGKLRKLNSNCKKNIINYLIV